MRINSWTLSYLVFGLVVMSLAVSRGDDEGDRIVGGSEVDPHSIPWQVGLMNKGSNFVFCGGSILSATKILTAAHCYKRPSSIQVVVGEHRLNSAADGVRHDVRSFVVHPGYNRQTIDKDVAIITLSKPIDLNDKAKAVCLPKSITDPNLRDGQSLTVSGWGRLSGSSSGPDVLHAVRIPYMPPAECRRAWGSSRITNNMLCAGQIDGSANGLSACNGDSGGPLTVGRTIVGVVSWGRRGCGYQSGVYAKVSVFLSWIASQGVANNCGAGPSPVVTTTTTTSAPTTTCTDRASWCSRYTRYCSRLSSLGRYMRRNCAKTCGVTANDHPACPRYSTRCNVVFGNNRSVADYCPVMCKVCNNN